MLELKNIHISYDNKECIKNGNFQAYPCQITGIYGESGTGKSSLLYILGMLSQQSCDFIYNNDILQLNEKQREIFRRNHISFVTQDSALIDIISVEKNIEFFLSLTNNPQYTVEELLNKVNMLEKKNAMIQQLSGGERQRVAIACALAKNSDIILGDEVTSALDEENKKVIMSLLKACADKGKTVILVSHEKNIIEQCDRVYEIDHLELILRKKSNDIEIKHDMEKVSREKKVKALEMFELLFHSNKKINRNRILISFIVMCVLFTCASIIVQSQNVTGDIPHAIGKSAYSLEDVSDKKMLILNNKGNELENYGLIKSLYSFTIFEHDYESDIKNIEHVDNLYDYYIFPYSGEDKTGYGEKMDIIATRNGQNVAKLEVDEKYKNSAEYKFDFQVIPIFPEERKLKDNEVIVSRTLAYMYQLEVGDELEIKFNVPYAMYYAYSSSSYGYMVESVTYKGTITDIIESNTAYNELYISYDIMKNMIGEQVKKYQNGEIAINYQAYQGYSEIIDLSAHAYAVFADQYENVLKVQNEIRKLSGDLFVSYEYQNVIHLQEQTKELATHTFQVALFGVGILFAGALLIELISMWKYQSVYMLSKMVGYHKDKKNKILMIHGLWQIGIMICASMIIYITASIPTFLIVLGIGDFGEIYQHLPVLYFQYTVYGAFSWMHFGILIVMIVFVVSVSHIYIKIFYERMDIMTWMRKRSIY